uniref:Zinc finger and BTB domain containing 21 n=1 Tax=Electrophorus electricus TaxID=8005 RepID=A0AAY5ENJ7_ELEEL
MCTDLARSSMESLVHYSSPSHALSVLGLLNEQRLHGHLCDVVLVVGEHHYQAHRSVLAASSEYFHSLFARKDAESHAVVQLDFCEPDAFEIVLNYIYSSSLFVDKSSLAVVQELGYSLGIPYLTSIMSVRPQVSYCVSRKKLCFSEEDDGPRQKRSVIVRQGGAGDAHRGRTGLQRIPKHAASTSAESLPSPASRDQPCSPGHGNTGTHAPSVSRNADSPPQDVDRKPVVSLLPSILKSHAEPRPSSGRLQLTSSVSFSESGQSEGLHSEQSDESVSEEKVDCQPDSKPVPGGPHKQNKQTIDRSGPLIKSLLRRSLSMDSPLPAFSPVLELRDSHAARCSNPFKRSRLLNEHQFTHEDSVSDEASRKSNMDDGTHEPGELRPSKMFKCWSCLKVFRSNAGLYRHVNMYHNPEKPYACDICHKRFHTNFKVWTHCQTQHGVVQNPAPSSSSYSVLDEKFQRKLIDIVREREIKKALIVKLRRNKQSLQSQPFTKRSRRCRSYGCPYCRKMFFIQSHFKLHMKSHTAERASVDAREDGGGGGLHERPVQAGHVREKQSKDAFPCRLCSEKLASLGELESHERACRYATRNAPLCVHSYKHTSHLNVFQILKQFGETFSQNWTFSKKYGSC